MIISNEFIPDSPCKGWVTCTCNNGDNTTSFPDIFNFPEDDYNAKHHPLTEKELVFPVIRGIICMRPSLFCQMLFYVLFLPVADWNKSWLKQKPSSLIAMTKTQQYQILLILLN